MCARLAELASCGDVVVRVAIEVPRASVVETLPERGHEVFVENPEQLDRFRDGFTMAGAKDDRPDALVPASALPTDRERFRQLEADDPMVIKPRERSQTYEEIGEERGCPANRFGRQLRRCSPQFLTLSGEVAAPRMLALWVHVPTPAGARTVRARSIDRLLKGHRIRRYSGREVLGVLRQEPLHVAPGTTEAVVEHIKMLLPRLEVADTQLKQCRRRLRECPGEMTAAA